MAAIEPHVDLPGALLADALQLPLLEHPEQLRLQLERDLAHLVEEQGAAVGQLEPPGPVAQCAGERAPGRGRRTRSRTARAGPPRSSP